MGIVRVKKEVRVAFLTDSSFDRVNMQGGGQLKKRALRELSRRLRVAVYEDSNNPDVIFEVRRQYGTKGWHLHRKVYRP